MDLWVISLLSTYLIYIYLSISSLSSLQSGSSLSYWSLNFFPVIYIVASLRFQNCCYCISVSTMLIGKFFAYSTHLLSFVLEALSISCSSYSPFKSNSVWPYEYLGRMTSLYKFTMNLVVIFIVLFLAMIILIVCALPSNVFVSINWPSFPKFCPR